ncbi:MAG TPA: hypothetical protein VGI40_23985 [Pirellulaceae bacterium]|jgi:hypothetical protein
MIRPTKSIEIGERLSDSERVTEAVREAGREARLKHKQLGVPIVVWRDGQVVEIPPEEIVIDPPAAASVPEKRS